MVGLYYTIANRITRSNLIRTQAMLPSCYTTTYSCLGSILLYWCGLRVFPPNTLQRQAFLMTKGGTSDVDPDPDPHWIRIRELCGSGSTSVNIV